MLDYTEKSQDLQLLQNGDISDRQGGTVPQDGGYPAGLVNGAYLTKNNKSDWRWDSDKKWGKMTFWKGGACVKVRKPKTDIKGHGGGVRGQIGGFSRASRRRLMKTVSKTKKNNLPVFVTLTYPSEWPGEPKEWKRHLQNFLKRLVYKFPRSSGVWKLEPQKRGAPHYHLLVWGVDYVDLLGFCSRAWYKVVGSGDTKHLRAGTRVEKVRKWRGVMSYCSKYLGKDVEKLPGWESVGRYWGVFMRDNVPWAALVTVPLTYKQVVQVMRYLRRYAHLKSRSYQSLEVIVGEADFWFDRIDQIVF